jgi:hypothetical protein
MLGSPQMAAGDTTVGTGLFPLKEVVKALLFEHSVVMRDGFVKLRPE